MVAQGCTLQPGLSLVEKAKNVEKQKKEMDWSVDIRMSVEEKET